MNIKEFMTEFNVTHEQLSRALGISTPYVTQMANGKTPSPKLALKIEQVTFGKVTKEELLPDVFGVNASYGLL